MTDRECIVLYTNQKHKKAKTWHDGVLKVLTHGTRAILFDDKQTKIDAVHIKPEAIVCGEQLESDRHLILIEDIKSGVEQNLTSSGQSAVNSQHFLGRPAEPSHPATGIQCQRLSIRAGIKRRKTGFVPPRMVKQPRLDNDDQTVPGMVGHAANNTTGGSSCHQFTNNTHGSPLTSNVLNLYSRTGASSEINSVPPSSCQRNAGSPLYGTSRNNVLSNMVQRSYPDHNPISDPNNLSPTLGQNYSHCDESQARASNPSSPWTSFGADRLTHVTPLAGRGSSQDSFSSNRGVAFSSVNDQQQSVKNTEKHSLNQQGKTYMNVSRVPSFCEGGNSIQQKDICRDDQWVCSNDNRDTITNQNKQNTETISENLNKKVSGVKKCHNEINIPLKRSALQILALLGKSRNKNCSQTSVSPSDSQNSSYSEATSGVTLSPPVEPAAANVEHFGSSNKCFGGSETRSIVAEAERLSQNSSVPGDIHEELTECHEGYQGCINELDSSEHLISTNTQNTALDSTVLSTNKNMDDGECDVHANMLVTCSDVNNSAEKCSQESAVSIQDHTGNDKTGKVCASEILTQELVKGDAALQELMTPKLGISTHLQIDNSDHKNFNKQSEEMCEKPDTCSHEDDLPGGGHGIDGCDIGGGDLGGVDLGDGSHDIGGGDLRCVDLGGGSHDIGGGDLGGGGHGIDGCDIGGGDLGGVDLGGGSHDIGGGDLRGVDLGEGDLGHGSHDIGGGDLGGVDLSGGSYSHDTGGGDLGGVDLGNGDLGDCNSGGHAKCDLGVVGDLCEGDLHDDLGVGNHGDGDIGGDIRTSTDDLDDGAHDDNALTDGAFDGEDLDDGDLSGDDLDGGDLGLAQQASFLISFSPLSHVSSSDTEDICSDSNTLDKKPISVIENGSPEDSDGQDKGKRDTPSSSREIYSEDICLPHSGESDTCKHSSDVEASKDEIVSLLPERIECEDETETASQRVDLVKDENDVKPEYLKNINDLNFSPDSVNLVSLSSLESRGENSDFDGKLWKVNKTVRNSFASQDLPTVIDPRFTSECNDDGAVMSTPSEINTDTGSLSPCDDALFSRSVTSLEHQVNKEDVDEAGPSSFCGRDNVLSSTGLGRPYHLTKDVGMHGVAKEHYLVTDSVRSTQMMGSKAVGASYDMTEEPLPHPSQLRRPSITPHTAVRTTVSPDMEDPLAERIPDSVCNRLQQYTVRGSVKGGVVRRSGKSHPRLTSPTVLPSQDHRPGVRGILYSPAMSPNQSLENTHSLPDQNDHSFFIDWNVGKPKMVDLANVCKAQDIQIPGSPYQHVPVFKPSEKDCTEGSADVVPDIDFGTSTLARDPRRHNSDVFCRSPGSIDSPSSELFTNRSAEHTPKAKRPFEAESPSYGSMFKLKRNMNNSATTVNSRNVNKHVGENTHKELVPLRCNPFGDPFTHTSFTSSYFSQATVETNVGTQSTEYRKSGPEVADHVDHAQVVTKFSPVGYSMESKGDLHLSLSSVGSSDLEFSFTSGDPPEGQVKPDVDFSVNHRPCSSNTTEAVNVQSWSTSKFKVENHSSNGDYELSRYSTSTCSNGHQESNSKWEKFVVEDENEEMIFDDSFEEQYQSYQLKHKPSFNCISSQNQMLSESCNLKQQQQINCRVVNNALSSCRQISAKPTTPDVQYHEGHTFRQDMSSTQNWTRNQSLPEVQNTTLSPIGYSSTPNHVVFSPENIHMSPLVNKPTPSYIIPVKERTTGISPLTTSVESNLSQEVHICDNDMVGNDDVMIQPSLHQQNPTKRTAEPYLSNAKLGKVTDCGTITPRCGVLKGFQSPVPNSGLVAHVLKVSKRNISGELQFATKEEVDSNPMPLRQVSIPGSFPSVAVYKQVLKAALKEHLNIILFGLAQLYHHAMEMVDVASYCPAQHPGPLRDTSASLNQASLNPNCQCGAPSKIVQVKKAGNNKGRFFYTCNAARNKQCKYFQWADQTGGGRTSNTGASRMKLCDAASIGTYIRGHHLMFYCECELLKKSVADIRSSFNKNIPKWVKMKYQQTNQDSKKIYIKLSRKDASSLFAKDDLWIISQTLDFHPSHTFLAKSTYFGPNSANEVEIEPITGFSPSNWPANSLCHAILAGNVTSELSYLSNIDDNLSPVTLPILQWLLDSVDSSPRVTPQPGGFKAPVRTAGSGSNIFAPKLSILELADECIQRFSLNPDQSSALMRVCNKFSGTEDRREDNDPVLLIHGVFGAGKSFLLSVIVLFLVKVFEVSDSYTPGLPHPWKILISSTTNVAVDRILNGLLSIEFEDFVRVGSMKKISKPILPYSVHATGSESQELKDLQEMLRSGELTPSEKHNVRQSIEKHRLGENKKRLGKVRVVGVTCASCTASSLASMAFPVVMLDESSQMTEPASMLPIAKFSCEKLLLVGDPKQLDPTIQGSEAAHSQGLEQTLFDRLMNVGHTPTTLRTQYRCHPVISNLANTLFYDGQLLDGVSVSDREPLVPEFPTLCFFDVDRGREQSDDGGSFYNEEEAVCVTSLIQALLARGMEPTSIGVITLYKSQMYKINTSLLTTVKSESHKEIKATRVSTVDAFQGGEHDIIILSCVRTKGIGFIDNHKRTNVALTRARHHLLIVGNKSNLLKNKLWGQVIQLCERQPGGIQEADTFLQQLGEADEDPTKDKSTAASLSPPMSLSSQESTTPSHQHDQENTISGAQLSPLRPSVLQMRQKRRVINAELLENTENSDSDEELPSL